MTDTNENPRAQMERFEIGGADRNERSMRRADIYKLTPAELAIRNALIEVEKLPANPMLTNAVTRLASAAKHIADYVDINPTLDISQPARIGVGAIVRLNSGGPNMLVTYGLRDNEGWQCEYAGPGGLTRSSFAEAMLTLLIPPPELISMIAPDGVAFAEAERSNPHRHGSDEREPADMRLARHRANIINKGVGSTLAQMDAEIQARIDAKVGIGSAATPATLLGIATTLKPAEEVLIAYADIEHAFPQWKAPLPEIAPSEQFRGALAKLPGTYDLSFQKHDHWANDPANNQPLDDGQWRLTRLVTTASDMDEVLRSFLEEGHGSRRLAQVIRSVLWHATEFRWPKVEGRNANVARSAALARDRAEDEGEI